MKVAQLTGAKLDYWVCKAEGLDVIVAMRENCGDTEPSCLEVSGRGVPILRHSPSTSWSEGGPIIDRERISIKQDEGGGCYAYFDHLNPTASGQTALIAAMRAYVASKFGEEVPDEGC